MEGKFITLEGIDGVGKSTQMACIGRLLKEAGIDYIATREPGGTPLAEEIRRLLLEVRDEPVAGLAELLLVFAARSQHLEERILPALDAGVWVVSERFTDATYAYQGGARGLSERAIGQLESLVQGALQPHLTLYLDAPLATAAQRMGDRAGDRFEREGTEFFHRVREGYLSRARRHARIVVVDAARPVGEVSAAVAAALGPLISARSSKLSPARESQ
ncbi:MAG: dTMP kinase [Gammaproteobacteria bacterium]|nr:dTMP kinase [Gammaproteobacteria bacterium]